MADRDEERASSVDVEQVMEVITEFLITRMVDAVCGVSDHAEGMTERNPHARYCPHCGEQFGHAWVGVGLKQHLWEVHGIPGETIFNGKVIQSLREGSGQ